MADARWEFWVDRGGTFTDVVARDPDGRVSSYKLLSENPEQYADAPVAGIRQVLGLAADAPITLDLVASVKMGTTVATNALLERRGEPTLLVTTQGFGDALRIGYQERPRLFDRRIVLPELLYARVVEANERVDAAGDVVVPLDDAALAVELAEARASGLSSVAIVFMHGYRNPVHEQRAARLAREAGFAQVSVSHEVSPLVKLVGRGDTTVVDAYLSPILRRYVDGVAAQMPGVPLLFMQSNGGLTQAHAFQGKDAVLSGPAGGVVGMARTAELAARASGSSGASDGSPASAASAGGEGGGGPVRVIGFDMGGTSTDVSHYAGEFERDFETLVAGVRLRAPMMSLHTVAAGGGSILHFDGAKLSVGPDSAGADPGPASYRRGGPLTVTDANVLLGRIQPQHFPHVFGPNADEPLDAATVAERFADLADRVSRETGAAHTAESIAAGCLDIAVQAMAGAIKKVSIARGHDVTRYLLQCFGGAGGQHACAIAASLGIRTVLVHPFAGVLSAYGMGLAEQTVMREAAVGVPLAGSRDIVDRALDALAESAATSLREQGASPESVRVHRRLHVRFAGTDTSLPIDDADEPTVRERFTAEYRRRFSFLLADRELVVEAVSVEAVAAAPGAAAGHWSAGADADHGLHAADAMPEAEVAGDAVAGGTGGANGAVETVRLFAAGAWRDAPLVERASLAPGQRIDGPALITEANATTFVDAEWSATVSPLGDLVLERVGVEPDRVGPTDTPAAAAPAELEATAATEPVDPIRLEVFNNLFMNIAEQMGVQLRDTATSVNMKERLDFSCALFDPHGDLIANAPHIPVHLGSMSESVRSVVARHGDSMREGDVFVLNDPYNGGTHLPDITVVTPVYVDGVAHPAFFVASRGHHADVGGLTPGSMPPDSTTIDEEGVLIDNAVLVRDGEFQHEAMLRLLTSGPYPSRNPEQNLTDLQAQIAANETGAALLRRLAADEGLTTVHAYMGHVQDHAEESVRRAISRLDDGAFTLPMDNGARICVRIEVDRAQRGAVIDFAGTSEQRPDNFNAPSAVCMAAVLYVFRTLVDDEIPLNAGCLKPLDVRIPPGSMLAPEYPAAVVAGNVEVSSCVTNALYGALGTMAASQCTVNNFTFGNAEHQYYETISGGSGAGPGFDGTAVVQTHMTNSRLTDPEVLELRHPVRVDAYAIRRGSGGDGRWRGGDGGSRRIRFLESMTASILSNGRVVPAFGVAGGAAGARGINRVERADGSIVELGHTASVSMQPGDVFIVDTPGGGGYGAPVAESSPSVPE